MPGKLHTLKEAIRNPFCFPGGYEKAIYLVDGERICTDCARKNFREIAEQTIKPGSGDSSWGFLGVDVHWEGSAESCCQCGKEMPSEYGDPDDEQHPDEQQDDYESRVIECDECGKFYDENQGHLCTGDR